MRLDKFLKLYRIIKRRTLAQQACDDGFVLVNGRPAKSGKELSQNDEVTVNFTQAGNRVRVKILRLRDGNVVSPEDISVTEEKLQ
ncbi:MAG TPA: S4 domain-containing protein [Candidatus Wallbacteria bacterium]|nr:MAG: S4 domain protein [bacterium ADurb.Bin243]HPG56631.1 S4 domain-containing protein [Candidatus Wallbacteria bacterium]